MQFSITRRVAEIADLTLEHAISRATLGKRVAVSVDKSNFLSTCRKKRRQRFRSVDAACRVFWRQVERS